MRSFLIGLQAASPILLVIYVFAVIGFLLERFFGDELLDPVAAYHNPNV